MWDKGVCQSMKGELVVLSYSEVIEPANVGFHSGNVCAVLSELLKRIDICQILVPCK